jgi:hypothetical protein
MEQYSVVSTVETCTREVLGSNLRKETEQVSAMVTFCICIRVVLGSNLENDTCYRDRIFLSLCLSLVS